MTEEKKYPSRSAEQFVVRFPDGMRDRIAEAAKANNRSMNAEIVARLQDSFHDRLDLAEYSEEEKELFKSMLRVLRKKDKS